MGKSGSGGMGGYTVAQQQPSAVVSPDIDYSRIWSILNSNVLNGQKLPTSGAPPAPAAPPATAASGSGKPFDLQSFMAGLVPGQGGPKQLVAPNFNTPAGAASSAPAASTQPVHPILPGLIVNPNNEGSGG